MNITPVAACVIYATMGLLSAGYVLRSPAQRRWTEALAAAALWPLYWLVYVGPTQMLRRLMGAFFTEEGAVLLFCLIALYSFIVLMFPAYYIAKTWDTCSGFGCAAIFAKAVIWAPFWPAYLLAGITQ